MVVAQGLEGGAALEDAWNQFGCVQNCLKLVGGASVVKDSAAARHC